MQLVSSSEGWLACEICKIKNHTTVCHSCFHRNDKTLRLLILKMTSSVEYQEPGIESRFINQVFFALMALSLLASRDFFLAAVFLCIVLVDAVLSSFLVTSLNCSVAASTLPLSRISSKCLICVLTRLLRARFVVLLFTFCLALFFACNECATVIS